MKILAIVGVPHQHRIINCCWSKDTTTAMKKQINSFQLT